MMSPTNPASSTPAPGPSRRPTSLKEVAQGAGCSACSGGLGTTTYDYTPSSNPVGYNSWATKTVETLPDGNQNVVYMNYRGEVMLKDFREMSGGVPTGNDWDTFYQYDGAGP